MIASNTYSRHTNFSRWVAGTLEIRPYSPTEIFGDFEKIFHGYWDFLRTINKQSEKLYDINIKMTLTAPGCGMAGHIAGDVKHNVELIPGVQDVVVDIVWEPQWSQNMMSDAAKLQLGMM